MPRTKGAPNKKSLMPFTLSDIEKHYRRCCEIAEELKDFDKFYKLLEWESNYHWGRPSQRIEAKIDTDVSITVSIGEKQLPAIDITDSGQVLAIGQEEDLAE